MYFFTLLLLAICFKSSHQYATVEQVHLSWNGKAGEMVVTWLTKKPLSDKAYPFVRYGTDTSLTHHIRNATVKAWIDHGKQKVVRYTYSATMSSLTTGKRYYYAVGSDEKISKMYDFMPIDISKNVRVAIFGDFAVTSGYTLEVLTTKSLKGHYDLIIHIGDIAYNLQDNNGAVGDEYMNAIQSFAAYVPYMTIAGNHEYDQNGGDFNNYENRFKMPSNGLLDDNQFWSVTIGNLHLVGISTEYYGYQMSNEAQMQYQWLMNDLKANSKVSWTAVFMHRPMFCSNQGHAGCEAFENIITRDGAPGYPALEPLFNSAGVDMVYWGHSHTYQRNWPVYKLKTQGNQKVDHYHNAETPVYILTGAAGCHSHQVPGQEYKQSFTATMLGNYGYSVLEITNQTAIYSYFVDGKTGDHFDKFTLTKDYLYTPGQHVH